MGQAYPVVHDGTGPHKDWPGEAGRSDSATVIHFVQGVCSDDVSVAAVQSDSDFDSDSDVVALEATWTLHWYCHLVAPHQLEVRASDFSIDVSSPKISVSRVCSDIAP